MCRVVADGLANYHLSRVYRRSHASAVLDGVRFPTFCGGLALSTITTRIETRRLPPSTKSFKACCILDSYAAAFVAVPLRFSQESNSEKTTGERGTKSLLL
jgi:hypothetical protein